MNKRILLLLIVCAFFTLRSIAQLIPGDVNKPVNQVYALGAANYGSDPAPTFTVTAPTTCGGTGSVTITWVPTVSTAAKNRRFVMHNAMNFSGNLIYPCAPTPCPPGALTLNQANGYSQTFTALAPGLYTFGLNRDPGDDDLTTNNAGGGALDDFSSGGWNDPTSDQSRCAVVGLTLVPTSNNLTTCTIAATNASNCTTNNGSVTISNLSINTQYDVSFLVNGAFSYSNFSGPTGVITVPNLLTGIYPIRIRRQGELCYRQFNIKVGNNSGIDCFADNQLIDPQFGTTMITNGNFGVATGTLPLNGVTDYSLVAWSSGDPGDSRYALTDSTIFAPANYNYRLRNLRFPADNRHLYACIQRTGDHTGSLNQNNGNTGAGQGFMMVVNANYRTDRVVEVGNLSLIQGRSYVFSYWAKNLQAFMPRNKNNGTSLTRTFQPIIPKLALAVNGIIYDFADMSAVLEPASYTGADTALIRMGWEQYNIRFIAPVTNATSTVTVYNFQQGGFGNDFAIDDVQLLALSVIGDRVWNDLDRDGTQDNNEPGMANIAVTLLDGVTDRPIQTTITDAFGYYQFANVAPAVGGTAYKVQFFLPSGYSYSPITVGGGATNAVDSDPSVTTGISSAFTLFVGETQTNIDCGLIFDQPLLPSSISDYVWFDANSNGIQETTENGLANITLTLYNSSGAVVASTVSNATGYYRFNNVTPGQYRVGITLAPGTILSGKDLGGDDNIDSDVNTSGINNRRTDLITVPANTQITNVDIGLQIMPITSSSFGDYCWIDVNQDGLQDANEPGLPGVKAVLFDLGADNTVNTGDDTRLDSTITDVFGKYQFTSLSGSRYYVRFYPPAGYSYTLQNVGSDETIDSDVISPGFSGAIIINNSPSGINYEFLDVGFYVTPPVFNAGRIGDFFWNDINGNGQQDAGEFGVPGITVELLNSSMAIVATTATDVNGFYVFVDVPPANYYIRFTNIPPGYQVTARDAGGSDNTDSDIDLATATTNIFTLSNNQIITNIDGGIRQVLYTGNSSVGSYVWYDRNNNGLQDLGETGVPNITVQLREAGPDGTVGNGDDVVKTTITNSLGQFIFNSLPQGLYRLYFGLIPSYLNLSPKDAGGAASDNIDSDGNPIVLTISQTDDFRVLFGEDKLNMGLGLNPLPTANTIGDRVWKDTNDDGIQDITETQGMQSVVVQLLDGTGTLIDSDGFTAGTQPYQTVSDAAGYWSFVGIPDGTYIPRFSFLPPGFRVAKQKATGSTNITDSDALGNGRSSLPVILNSGNRVDMNTDLGLVPERALVGDYVWDDLNGNGVQDATEPGISSVTATIFNTSDVALGSAVTNSMGRYYFPNVPPGDYYLRFTNFPIGMQYTIQEASPFITNGSNVNTASGKTLNYNIANNGPYGDTLHIDCGLRVLNTANVGNYVWFDANSNGIQNVGERALAGVVCRLMNAGADAIAGNADDFTLGSTMTDGNGYYQFIITPTGNNYYVRFSNIPISSLFTTPNLGSGSNDSRPNGSGVTPTFNLSYGGSNQNVDAGVINIAILTIAFEQFTAEKQGTGAILQWKLGNPTNIERYEILHSTNGYSFTKIATLPHTSNLDALQFFHSNPVIGNNYYKIIVYDFYNKPSASETKVVKFEKNNNFTIYPNPVNNTLFVNGFTTNTKDLKYRVIDVNGKQIKTGAIQNTIQSIDVQDLIAGTYLLVISQGNELKMQESFIKK